jgi:hypothetical protein
LPESAAVSCAGALLRNAVASAPAIPLAHCLPVAADPTVQAFLLPDIATFLLGTGLALLIALLAWGEQIRAITRDTRDLERDFLELTQLSRGQLNEVLHAETDDDRLIAFTNLYASGKLTSAHQVQILPLFKRWRELGSHLQGLQSKKYWLTITLTVVFFGSGIGAAVASLGALTLLTLLFPPAVLIAMLLYIVIAAGRVEQKLNEVLKQIAEKV